MSESNVDATSSESAATPKPAPAKAVATVTKFAAAHGGATAVIANIGESGARITLIGTSDAIMGDLVVADVATANAVVTAAGIESSEWVRELVSTATPKPGHNVQMAGYRARRSG